MKSCKISIILPVYNTSEYLDCCIKSLLSQTLEDIEIIAVNDGSTDNSFEILRKYQAENSGRLYVYNTENQGVSHARNFAVEKSCGEYLWFVDSDDYIEPDACEKLYTKAIDDGNDLVLFSRYDVDGETEEKTQNKTFHFNQSFKMADKSYELVKLSPFPWNKLVKRELFAKTHFPEGIRFEDLPVAFILAVNAKSIGVINDYFYDYRQRVGFLSKFNESTLDIVNAVDYMKSELESQGLYDCFKTEIEYVTVRHFLYRFEQLLTVNDKDCLELKKKLVNTLFDYLEKNYPNMAENPYLAYNLPDRIYQLKDFYFSKQALLDYIDKCQELSADEQEQLNRELTQKYEIIKEKVSKPFSEIKKNNEDASQRFKAAQNGELTNNAFFISSCAKSISPSMLSLMLELKNESSITLYCKKKHKDIDELLSSYGINATIINKKEDDYINALAKSKYVVADCPLDYYFTKADGQIYINNLADKPTVRLIAKNESKNDFSFMQKSLLTADCTIYSSEQGRADFEHKYRVEQLGVKSVENYHPFADEAIKVNIKNEISSVGKKLILIAPQHRYIEEKSAYRFFRKYMSYLYLLDKELDDSCDAYIYTGDYPYNVDLSIFSHIKKMPSNYSLYDFAKASDIVITDYHPILSCCSSNKIVRLFADEKRYVDDQLLDITNGNYISFTNPILLAEYINDYRPIGNGEISHRENTKTIIEKIKSGNTNSNKDEDATTLWYLGGKLTPARIRRFKAVARENDYKKFWLAFDEENAQDYKDELLDLFRGWNYIPMRFDNSSCFSDKIVSTICSKGKPPFASKKKLEKMKSDEWKKYFGDIKFDEITLISVGKIEQNLLFLGAAPAINYSFNWFSIDKYNNKKPFKAKVDYICTELESAQSVELPDEMKQLKVVKNLNTVDSL